MSQAEPTTYIGSPSHMRSPFKAITKKVNAKKVVPSSNLSKPLKSKQKIEKRKKERAQKAKQAKKTQAAVKAATKSTSKTTPKKKVVKAPALDPVHIVTSAAIKRVANRMGIPSISASCITAIQGYMSEKANETLLQARSCAQHISKTKTVHSKDLASAARTSNLGDLVCV